MSIKRALPRFFPTAWGRKFQNSSSRFPMRSPLPTSIPRSSPIFVQPEYNACPNRRFRRGLRMLSIIICPFLLMYQNLLKKKKLPKLKFQAMPWPDRTQ
jgi:hypothetical protein